jgi:hypothetical protein
MPPSACEAGDDVREGGGDTEDPTGDGGFPRRADSVLL